MRQVAAMRPAERYRTLAARIRRLVLKTRDPRVQAQLRATTSDYDKMADKVEDEPRKE